MQELVQRLYDLILESRNLRVVVQDCERLRHSM